MNNSHRITRIAAIRVLRLTGFAALVGLAVSTASAQAPTDPNAGGRRQRGGTGGQPPDAGNGGRGNVSPEEAQTRMLAGLRERFGITNDEEWGLISTRITAVMEVRRSIGGGGGGGFPGGFGGGRGGPPPGGGGADRGGRGGPGGRGSSQPEVAALQAAIADNLPEAEIKSRLDRVRELRKNAEAKIQKAQEELRAVLTVKQEATAVLAGLLP